MPKGILKYISVIVCAFFLCLPVIAKNDNDKKFIVVIDAGHGGKDIGAADNGVKEKDINLKVAKNLESLIKKRMKDTKVVMTRDDDTFLTLQERADKANKAQGDIFISIHTNSVAKTNPNRKTIEGSSVYTLGLHKDENNLEVAMRENSVIELEQNYQQKYSGFDPQRDESYIIFEMAQKKNLSQSIKFAENIEQELIKAGRQDRGVHQAGFWVLWATYMPAVLIELDFICNPKSAKYISSDKGAKELAEAIFKSVEAYENAWSKSKKSINESDLSDNFVEDHSSNLEDSYSVISLGSAVKAKTRVHKKAEVETNTGKRIRRSASSRLLSLNNTYEKNDLSYPVLSETSGNISTVYRANSQLAVVGNSDMKSGDNKTVNKAKDRNKEEKKKENEEKKKAEKEAKKRKQDAHNAKINKLVTVYKIQVLASTDLLSQDNSRFCGLSPISAYKENNLYKYYYGESTDKSEMETMLEDVKEIIPDAFIVSSTKTVRK